MDEQHYEYRTGRTQPQKKHNGVIAFLLILVIFSGGLVSALGLLNIHLFRLLDNKNDGTPLAFSQGEEQITATSGADSVILEGMQVQEVSDLYQQIYQLPDGLYISHVDDGSPAQMLGIAPGDVLTGFAGTPVSSLDALQTLLDTHTAGQPAVLTIFRDGQPSQFTVTLEVD